jgi:hypothetical protein
VPIDFDVPRDLEAKRLISAHINTSYRIAFVIAGDVTDPLDVSDFIRRIHGAVLTSRKQRLPSKQQLT